MKPWLLVDWGTSNVRAWVVDDSGDVGRHLEAPLGVGRLERGSAASVFVTEVQAPLQAQGLPTLMCGMIGSALGWAVAPYATVPTGGDAMAMNLLNVAPNVWIVPGFKTENASRGPDIMRGEETQILGWLAHNSVPAAETNLLCLPGTHSKWALVASGKILDFMTVMTGELFELVSKHSILAISSTPVDSETDFLAGVACGNQATGLGSALFSARARMVTGSLSEASVPSFVSGVLVGNEIESARAFASGITRVQLIGTPQLCHRYALALEACGFETQTMDGGEAVRIGLLSLARELTS
jgi:2-dehydro-3-deoxygalactonokinase